MGLVSLPAPSSSVIINMLTPPSDALPSHFYLLGPCFYLQAQFSLANLPGRPPLRVSVTFFGSSDVYLAAARWTDF